MSAFALAISEVICNLKDTSVTQTLKKYNMLAKEIIHPQNVLIQKFKTNRLKGRKGRRKGEEEEGFLGSAKQQLPSHL